MRVIVALQPLKSKNSTQFFFLLIFLSRIQRSLKDIWAPPGRGTTRRRGSWRWRRWRWGGRGWGGSRRGPSWTLARHSPLRASSGTCVQCTYIVHQLHRGEMAIHQCCGAGKIIIGYGKIKSSLAPTLAPIEKNLIQFLENTGFFVHSRLNWRQTMITALRTRCCSLFLTFSLALSLVEMCTKNRICRVRVLFSPDTQYFLLNPDPNKLKRFCPILDFEWC